MRQNKNLNLQNHTKIEIFWILNNIRCKLYFNCEYSHPVDCVLVCEAVLKELRNYNDAPVSSAASLSSSLLAKYIKPQRERAGCQSVRVSLGQGQAASSTSGRQSWEVGGGWWWCWGGRREERLPPRCWGSRQREGGHSFSLPGILNS